MMLVMMMLMMMMFLCSVNDHDDDSDEGNGGHLRILAMNEMMVSTWVDEALYHLLGIIIINML